MLKCMKTPPSLRRHPSPSRLSSGVRSALGFGMLETLLTLTGLTVFSVVAIASYQHVSAKATTESTVSPARVSKVSNMPKPSAERTPLERREGEGRVR